MKLPMIYEVVGKPLALLIFTYVTSSIVPGLSG